MNFEELAKRLDEAAIKAKAIPQLSTTISFDLDQAYDIQKRLIDQRLNRGANLIGLKMGFTSEAKMKQMGVSDLIWGRLTDDMWIDQDGIIDIRKYIHPRAEPEICFRISKDIHDELELNELFAYVDGVAPAIEIIDSRYENFKFSLEDVIADNCSSTGVVVGEWKSPTVDLSDLKMEQFFNDELVSAGRSQAILGNAWKSLQAATRLAKKYNEPIKAGHIIMAGAATAAEFLKPSTKVKVKVEHLGEVGFSVQ